MLDFKHRHGANHCQLSISVSGLPKVFDEKVAPWKAANDKVGEIGGWRAYLKEAQAKETNSFTGEDKLLTLEAVANSSLPVRMAWFQAVAKQEQTVYAKQMQPPPNPAVNLRVECEA